MKECTKCKKIKCIDSYYKNKKSCNGRYSICKQCISETAKSLRKLKRIVKVIVNISEKACKTCKILKNVSNFSKKNTSKDGYRSVCKLCRSLESKNYYNNNKETCQITRKKYYKNNKDKFREYNIKNKEKIKERKRVYDIKNRHKANKREKDRRAKGLISINRKISNILRSRIRGELKGIRKSAPTLEILGCSIKFFKEYIASKFTQNMTWENHGKNGWHLDHILPCNSFNLSDLEQQKLCFHYTNFQPLWATTDIAIKHGESSNYIGNLEKYCKIL